ncbi:bifunctional enoyl-CoA hydratase/phosphate acetyltransferase [Paraburkholderia sp. HD33-4]|uniref:bifunctional enoyl-CoA hydratase/phosphate acetyltransferase n=1 Tax=Paraburkholderia sp. HD33-4 TaxID=2883242 RepID=UPI001F201CE6|nr:bifunctional enoyl-CoA hydratase/phosphate acetyltransferase [Paraburkholderia sp. HD33-4]
MYSNANRRAGDAAVLAGAQAPHDAAAGLAGALAADRLPGLLCADAGASAIVRLARNAGPLRVAVVHPCDATSLEGLLVAATGPGGGLITPVIVAPRAKLDALARTLRVDLTGFEIEDVPHSHAAAARAVELVAQGAADALMKGSLHTDELMSAVLAPGSGLLTDKRVSHCFLVETRAYERPFIVTDAVVNIAPDLEQKQAIAQNAIDLAHALGVAEPRVAVVCAVETVNPRMRSTIDAAALAKMSERGQLTGALVDGPLAFDNAVSVRAARIKGIKSPVAGHADILLVPDLEAGNMLVKQLEFLGEAASAGLVVGARVPIILTSRADSLAARVNSCALAAATVVRRGVTPESHEQGMPDGS